MWRRGGRKFAARTPQCPRRREPRSALGGEASTLKTEARQQRSPEGVERTAPPESIPAPPPSAGARRMDRAVLPTVSRPATPPSRSSTSGPVASWLPRLLGPAPDPSDSATAIRQDPAMTSDRANRASSQCSAFLRRSRTGPVVTTGRPRPASATPLPRSVPTAGCRGWVVGAEDPPLPGEGVLAEDAGARSRARASSASSAPSAAATKDRPAFDWVAGHSSAICAGVLDVRLVADVLRLDPAFVSR
jgi:hypothetical protein